MKFKSVNISDQPKAKWDIMFPLMLKTFPIMKDSGAKLITKDEARALGNIWVSDSNNENLVLVANEDYRGYTNTWDEVRKYMSDTWEGIRIGMELPRTKKNKIALGLEAKPRKPAEKIKPGYCCPS